MWPDVDGRSNGYVINNFMYRRSSNHKDGAVWFTKCNAKGNDNGLHSITVGNKFE
jgi:hypothetical protein